MRRLFAVYAALPTSVVGDTRRVGRAPGPVEKAGPGDANGEAP